MRFEKLRTNVGIAIAIFIFIVGNIMVFGLLITPTKNAQANIPMQVYNADNSNSQVSNQDAQSAAQSPPSVAVQQNPTPIIQTFRTRAS